MLSALSSTNTDAVGETSSCVEGQQVDPRIGFSHPDGAGVDDDLEQLVERERRLPVVTELGDVVGQQRELEALGLQFANAMDDRPVDADGGGGHEPSVGVDVEVDTEDLGARAWSPPK